MLPMMFLRINPLALLISMLYTMGELNKHNEIIGIRSAGISILRISIIPIIFATLISTFAFFLQEKMLIYSYKATETIKLKYFSRKVNLDKKIEKNIYFTSGNKIIYIREFIPAKMLLKDVQIIEEDTAGNIIKTKECTKMIYKNGSWIGFNVLETVYQDTHRPAKIFWEKKKIDISEKPSELSFKKSKYQQFYSLKTLLSQIKELRKYPASLRLAEKILSFHKKITDPLTGLFLIIGALPIALEIRQRKIGLSALGIGLILYFVYNLLLSISIPLGKIGILLPGLSAWIAPLFFISMGVVGLILIR